MAKVNGTLYALFVGATDKILYLKNCSLTVNVALPDSTNKESAGWAEHILGLRDASYTFDGEYDLTQINAAGLTADAILDNIIARTADAIVTFTPDSLSTGYEGYATFSNITFTAGTEDTVKYSGSMKVNGALAKVS
jgi:hypothetical protein